MADQEAKNPFEFEVLLKRVDTQLNSEQMSKLQHWRKEEIACENEWERFNLNKNEDNATRNKKAISELLNSETEIIVLLADLYLSIPDPADAVNLFDSGKERDRLTNLRKDVIKIQKIVSAAFSTNKINDNVISNFIDKTPSSDTPQSNTPSKNLDNKDAGQSVNVWAYKNSISNSQQHEVAETQADKNTELWISTLNTNQEAEDDL